MAAISQLLSYVTGTIADFITDIIVAFLTIIEDLAACFMVWVFNYFTSDNGFLTKLSRENISFRLMFASTHGKNYLEDLVNQIFLPLSLAIAIIIFAYTLLQTMLTDKAKEGPGKIVIRILITFTLIFGLYPALNVVQDVAETAEVWVNDVMEQGIQVLTGGDGTITTDDISGLDTLGANIFTGDDETSSGNMGRIGIRLFSIIIIFILGWKYLKLIVQYLGRYVRLMMIRIFAPLASCTYASLSTVDIFKAYIRMYISSLIALVTSQAMILLVKFACIVTLETTSNFTTFMLYYCMTLALIQFVQDLDDYLDKLKLSSVGIRTPFLDAIGMGFMRAGMKEITDRLPWGKHPLGAGLVHSATNAALGTSVGATIGSAVTAARHPITTAKDQTHKKAAEITSNAIHKDADGFGAAVNVADKESASKAINEAKKGAFAKVTASGGNSHYGANLTMKDGKYSISREFDGISHDSVGSVLGAVNTASAAGISKVTATGMDGNSYSIKKENKEGKSVFSATDQDGKIVGEADNWSGALDQISSYAGGLNGSSQIFTNDGHIIDTTSEKGQIKATQEIGNYNSAKEAMSALKKEGYSSFQVTNGAGYDSGKIDINDLGKMMDKASSISIKYTDTNGVEHAGIVHQSGRVSVYDRENKRNVHYDSVDNFTASQNISSISFGYGSSYTGKNGKELADQKNSFFSSSGK